jgi:glycosyltransferase involved in cell wall biosynthesis
MGIDEIIVADGGSTDGTVEIARSENVTVVVGPRGRGTQIAAALSQSSSEVAWVVHVDCLPCPEHYGKLQQALNTNSRIWGAFTVNHQVPAGASKLIQGCLSLANRRSRRTSFPYGDQAIFFHRDLIEQIGGFPEQELMEDLELSRRLNEIMSTRIIDLPISVSGRRFVKYPIKTVFSWLTFPWLYRLGVPPRQLLRWYEG